MFDQSRQNSHTSHDNRYTLKMIMYFSKSRFADQLSMVNGELTSILVQSRQSNFGHKITGMLACRDGYYMEVLEGPVNEIDSLMVRISNDGRHSEPRIVLDKIVRERSFPKWSLKMVSSCHLDEDFNHYLNSHKQELMTLKGFDARLFGLFYDLSAYESETEFHQHYLSSGAA